MSCDLNRFRCCSLFFLSPYDGINRIRFQGSPVFGLSAALAAPPKRFYPQRTRRVLRVFFVFFVDKLIDKFFPLQFAEAAKIDEEAGFEACSLEVIQYL